MHLILNKLKKLLLAVRAVWALMLLIDRIGAILWQSMEKNIKSSRKQVVNGQVVPVNASIAKVKEFAFAKFDESVDVHVNLGIDAAKGEQAVRGSVVLPHGKGKESSVIVFAKGEYAEAAEKAGADFVGADDLD